ncbi:MAG: glycosyltransferase family 39 protein [Candidatus Moranbacteria bacterium]|nr:glycosyltransferase family 39 protein [Candidatus Moranbacteria bacterium]
MDHIKKHARLLVTLMLMGYFFLSLSLAWQESTTFDEKAHTPAAYSYVRFGDMRINPEHPPLLKDLAGIPLQFMSLSFPTDSTEWRSGINEQWTIGDRFLSGSGNDGEWVMFWARFPIILVALLLGFLIYRFTKELAGTVAGLFALLMYVADPNVIAHGHYVTTDLGIAAAIFLALIFFLRFLRTPDPKNTFLFGIFLGIAQLTKFSAVLLFPYIALVILIYALTRPKPDKIHTSRFAFSMKQLFSYILLYIAAIIICFIVVWALYFLNTINEPGTKIAENAQFVFSQDNLAAQFAASTVTTLSGSIFGKPFAQYLLGVFMVFARVAGGNTHYFLGEVTNQASPWYFPVVFMTKETIPFLFLLFSTATYTLFRIGRSFTETSTRKWHALIAHSFQTHISQYAMFGFAAFYAIISITGNLNIGFRHLFPILPFLYVLIAKVVFDFMRRKGFQGEHASRAALLLISLWIFFIPVLTYPSYLSYFNEASGSHKNGYQIVTDSNYDWGQDLKRLRDFTDEFNTCKSPTADRYTCSKFDNISQYPKIDKIRMAYFGGADPAYYLGDKYVQWYADWGRRSGWQAISVNSWQESLYQANPTGRETYQWIIDGDYPIAWRAGDSILVYYIPRSEDTQR